MSLYNFARGLYGLFVLSTLVITVLKGDHVFGPITDRLLLANIYCYALIDIAILSRVRDRLFIMNMMLIGTWSFLSEGSSALTLMSMGWASNFVPIALNGWQMPVRISSPELLRGVERSDVHCELTPDTRCWFLSDIWHGASPGDVLIWSGFVILFLSVLVGYYG